MWTFTHDVLTLVAITLLPIVLSLLLLAYLAWPLSWVPYVTTAQWTAIAICAYLDWKALQSF